MTSIKLNDNNLKNDIYNFSFSEVTKSDQEVVVSSSCFLTPSSLRVIKSLENYKDTTKKHQITTKTQVVTSQGRS